MQDIRNSKTAGVDFWRFLKGGADILAKPVSVFSDLSMSSGVFPNACKVAKLKPIIKKEKKTDLSSYRPISLLPVFSKIIEEIVNDQTIAFLSDKNIL